MSESAVKIPKNLSQALWFEEFCFAVHGVGFDLIVRYDSAQQTSIYPVPL